MAAPSVADWLDFMADTVTLEPCTGHSVSGAPTYGTAVSYSAYIEMKNRIIVDRNGREVTARGRVFLGTATVININDRITLPTGTIPLQPPIIAVNMASDEGGVHHVTLDIG